jgi:hypothetical protein
MQPIAVTAQLLRAQLPDLPLREGATLMARVASRGEHNAVLVLAGIPLTARVPPEVRAGETLRLKVQQVTAERITLQIDRGEAAGPAPGAPAAPEAQPASVPPPGPLAAQPPPAAVLRRPRVDVQDPPARRRAAGGEAADVVALAFTSPTLGRLDLRLELRGAQLLAEVTTAAGLPHAVATGAVERLRARLLNAGLEPTVQVHARRDPLDVYA